MNELDNEPDADNDDVELTRDNARLIGYTDDHQHAFVEVSLGNEMRKIPTADWLAVSGGDPPGPVPYPVPTDAIEGYLKRIGVAIKYHYDKYYDRLPHIEEDDPEKNSIALYSAFNYDGMSCFDQAAKPYIFSGETAFRASKYASRLWEFGAKPYFLRQPEGGATGYHNYNRGMMDRGNGLQTEAAMRCAYLSAYSQPYSITDRRWMRGWELRPRERALSVYSHLRVIDVTAPERWVSDPEIRADLRDEYLERAVKDHILGTHIPGWLDVDPDNWQTLLDANDWAAFVMGLSARTLIECVNKGLAERWGVTAEILLQLTRLADFVWEVAWRDDGKRAGLFYRPTEEHDEDPAPDLNMLAFPWWCWLAQQTEEERFYQRAELLLRGSSRAYLRGLKQLNQNLLWALDGFRYAGWLDKEVE